MVKIPFANSYVKLPGHFYHRVQPSSSVEPTLIAFNEKLAESLGIRWEYSSERDLAEVFSGKRLPEGADPIAMAYAGHQFGHFVPQLGDGRALLIGEVSGQYDVQLKGSGLTPFSRGGDGRSALGPVLREYLLSEAMHALGIPTTRALAAVRTGETVHREKPLPGAVFTRVASSHLRVGTFEFFASQGKHQDVKTLVDYAIQRHDPDLVNEKDRTNRFFERVAIRKLELVAKWMGIGFIHGVMNTDNTSISGETIDYGPCAFMDEFHHEQVFSSIDRRGRYAYSNQANVALWNLWVLARTLFPLLVRENETEEKTAKRIQKLFEFLRDHYHQKYLEVMTKKFGLFEVKESDHELIDDFLEQLQTQNLDFTLSFRKLSEGSWRDPRFEKAWKSRLKKQRQSEKEARDLMKSVNPYLIPRNHQIERAIQHALREDDSVFHRLIKAYEKPYEADSDFEDLTHPPLPEERVTQTFCGT
jgi:uncharacterized protein YdiU (UPF0061 family)